MQKQSSAVSCLPIHDSIPWIAFPHYRRVQTAESQLKLPGEVSSLDETLFDTNLPFILTAETGTLATPFLSLLATKGFVEFEYNVNKTLDVLT